MAIWKNDIMSLKENIDGRVGQKIIVKGTLGTNKPFEKEATIEKAYPAVFSVKYSDEQRDFTTYKYTDVLTKVVEVCVFDGENYSSIIPDLPDNKKHRA